MLAPGAGWSDGETMTSESAERLLQRWREGEIEAIAGLLPLVYADLRRIAGSLLRATPGHGTLQPTALVHEVMLRLLGKNSRDFSSTAHLVNASARMMRQILVDRARAAAADKRGGAWLRDELDESFDLPIPAEIDLLELDAALNALESEDPRMARAVELHYFVGLSLEEIGILLGVTKKTVHRDLIAARVWLRGQLEA